MLKAVSPTTNVLFHLMKFYWFTINGKKVMKSTFYSVPESHRICHVVFGIHISLGTSFLTWAYPALLGMALTFWRVLADCLEVCLSTGLCPFFWCFYSRYAGFGRKSRGVKRCCHYSVASVFWLTVSRLSIVESLFLILWYAYFGK